LGECDPAGAEFDCEVNSGSPDAQIFASKTCSVVLAADKRLVDAKKAYLIQHFAL
jgi:hypothetical protein